MKRGPSDTIAALRERLAEAPEDHAARLRLAERLVAEGQREPARSLLAEVEDAPPPFGRALQAQLAALEEQDGQLAAAAARWERLLADDVDDREAWAQLARLREGGAAPGPIGAAAGPAAVTLASAEGVTTARYEILRELGRGSSSSVYLARDRGLGLLLALKVLHPHVAAPSRSDARGRFFREARLAAASRHPGVIAIYDVDEAARTLVMEYVPGGSLRDRLQERARSGSPGLPAEELLALARALLATLDHLHARGIVHGDVTPRNVLLRGPGRPVLADFGIAELVAGQSGGDGQGAPRATGREEGPAGTPLYLAPEHFRGAPLSAASDLFATGAILWEAASGRPMREHADLAAGKLAAPDLPPEAARRLPAALVDVIRGLVRSSPEDRPASARAAAALLD